MAGGIVSNSNAIPCICGNEPQVIWFYIKGTANRKHYFVRCRNCNKRTNDRRYLENAISDWNNGKFRKQFAIPRYC